MRKVRTPKRHAAHYQWSVWCRRSMLLVVNCRGCQHGLHRPPELPR